MQVNNKKILWFCWGHPSEAEKDKAIAACAMIRDASAYHDGDFVEQCDAVMGEHVPAAYRVKFKYHGTVNQQDSKQLPHDDVSSETAASTEGAQADTTPTNSRRAK